MGLWGKDAEPSYQGACPNPECGHSGCFTVSVAIVGYELAADGARLMQTGARLCCQRCATEFSIAGNALFKQHPLALPAGPAAIQEVARLKILAAQAEVKDPKPPEPPRSTPTGLPATRHRTSRQ